MTRSVLHVGHMSQGAEGIPVRADEGVPVRLFPAERSDLYLIVPGSSKPPVSLITYPLAIAENSPIEFDCYSIPSL